MIACALSLIGCDMGHKENIFAVPEGFVPAERLIPDWKTVRTGYFIRNSELNNGRKFSVTDGSKTFECAGRDDKSYTLTAQNGRLKAHVLPGSRYDRQVASHELDTKLAERLEAIVPPKGVYLNLSRSAVKDAERWADGWLIALSRGEFGG